MRLATITINLLAGISNGTAKNAPTILDPTIPITHWRNSVSEHL